MRSAMMTMVAAAVLASSPSFAQTESVIWSFPAGSDPTASPHLDTTSGTLYGTSQGPSYGTVFILKERREVWNAHTLLTFDGTNGSTPYAGLVEDPEGNLYGTTYAGGTSGDGTVFELSSNGSSWNETVLYNFSGGSDGANPQADLIMDKATGAIYGTTSKGGECGTAFEMTQSGGIWSKSVIYYFRGRTDGCTPESRLREDSRGRLYGVTHGGGDLGYGTAFLLAKNSNIYWRELRLHIFTGGLDGGYPTDLDLDPTSRTLYGVISTGGTSNNGVVFQLRDTDGRQWTETPIYNFSGGSDGSNPVGLHLDLTSNTLYGATSSGGSNDAGSVFQLVIPGSQQTYSQLHSFGTSGDGANPAARPTVDPNTGYLYGTTEFGGANNGGTAWMIIP